MNYLLTDRLKIKQLSTFIKVSINIITKTCTSLFYIDVSYYLFFRLRRREREKKKKITCKVFEKIDFRSLHNFLTFFQIQWKLNYPCFHCPNTLRFYLRNTNYHMAMFLTIWPLFKQK